MPSGSSASSARASSTCRASATRTRTVSPTRPSTLSTDPFATLVARALGVAVDTIESERSADDGEVARAETERVRWRGPTGEGTVLFRRLPSAAKVEPALLPYLSRRGAPVARLLATGIPPRHAPESRAWVLVDEPPRATLASHDDARRAGESLRRLHTSFASEGATLQALGVPALDLARVREEARWAEELVPAVELARVDALAGAIDPATLGATTLVHGALDPARVRIGETVVLVAWSRAHLGSPLADVARLADALGANARSFLQGYGAEVDLDAGHALDRLLEIRWLAWEAREMLRSRPESATLIRRALGERSALG